MEQNVSTLLSPTTPASSSLYENSPYASTSYGATESITPPPPPSNPLYKLTNPYESPLLASQRNSRRRLLIALSLIVLVIIASSGITWLILSKGTQFSNDLSQRASQYSGTWINDDPNTLGIAMLEISSSGQTLTVHGYGACTPVYCDWGTRSGSFTGEPFIILFDFGNGNTHQLTISLDNSAGTKLKVIDNGSHSGIDTEYFHKQG